MVRVELAPQVDLIATRRVRTGDVLNTLLADRQFKRFRFCVAYMRLSGWDRLGASIKSLIERGGTVAGAVGIDQEVTSIEALTALGATSPDSTIFYTVSGLIFHPKLYEVSSDDLAVVVIGSPNLTGDGLFRNVEAATVLTFDLQDPDDRAAYRAYDALLGDLLDTSNPNVRRITASTIKVLVDEGLIKPESQVNEPGSLLQRRPSKRRGREASAVQSLFPPLAVPVAPPRAGTPRRRTTPSHGLGVSTKSPPSAWTLSAGIQTFIMELSEFDSSHRSGIRGTAELLIPHEAIPFFPPISLGGRKYPDAYFRAMLQTPTGPEVHRFRFWYYEERATGTRIDEYRLRVNHATADLSDPLGGDLLVITRLPAGSDPEYEMTVLSKADPSFTYFNGLCTRVIRDKRWGVV